MISLEELNVIFQLSISHARRMGIESVEPGNLDYYLTYCDERFAVGTTSKPAIGSLDDDIDELKKLLKEPERISSLDLDRLAEILHLLSDRLSGTLDTRESK